MRSRDDEPKVEAEVVTAADAPTSDPARKKTLEERVADLEKRLEPIIGPPGE